MIGAERERPPFSSEQCNALFAAVLVHDEIDLAATVPQTIHLDYTPEQFSQCFHICWQLWEDGVTRKDLSRIVDKISRHRRLDPADQQAFSHMRAKLKHLRFAYATFDRRHRYPRIFHWLTANLGYLQDFLKNRQFATLRRTVLLVRAMLAALPFAMLRREIDSFQPSTGSAFRDQVREQIEFVRVTTASGEVTSRNFHQVRKVVSRLVALYDNLKILYPTPFHHDVSRFLCTINGLMGAMHDDLVARNFEKTHDYHRDLLTIPMQIQRRLEALTRAYGISVAQPH